ASPKNGTPDSTGIVRGRSGETGRPSARESLQTEIVTAELESSVSRAVELLHAGEVVALPTETVYGLAADAFNPEAVARIFETKERPRFDPLIVHLPDRKALDQVSETERKIV